MLSKRGTIAQLVMPLSQLGGDFRATASCDSANRNWSLVAAPSPRLVTNVRCTVSKRHGNEKIIFISATKWMITQLSGIVETQLRHSRVGVAQLICKKNITAAWRNVANVPQLCLNYLPTVGWQMETVMAKWRVLETTGQQITITLQQHFCKNWIFFKNFWGGKKLKWFLYSNIWGGVSFNTLGGNILK